MSKLGDEELHKKGWNNRGHPHTVLTLSVSLAALRRLLLLQNQWNLPPMRLVHRSSRRIIPRVSGYKEPQSDETHKDSLLDE